MARVRSGGDEGVPIVIRFRSALLIFTCPLLPHPPALTQVTELPMEIVVCECSHVIQEDCVKLYIRKWASTGWFKLQVHRGGGGD